MPEDRVIFKTSTILIASGGKTRVFRSMDDVPADHRQRLVASTTGGMSATLLIADEGGRREIMRSLQGRPSAVETRWVRSVNAAAATGSANNGAVAAPYRGNKLASAPAISFRPSPWRRWRHWAEIGLLGGIGLCLWLLAAWK